MTNHLARLYALALAILVFFLSWAIVAARPFAGEEAAAPGETARPDAHLASLRARERELRRRIAAARELLGAAAVPAPPPPVQVVSAPPATVSRSS